jgi:hypothetical protein
MVRQGMARYVLLTPGTVMHILERLWHKGRKLASHTIHLLLPVKACLLSVGKAESAMVPRGVARCALQPLAEGFKEGGADSLYTQPTQWTVRW